MRRRSPAVRLPAAIAPAEPCGHGRESLWRAARSRQGRTRARFQPAFGQPAHTASESGPSGRASFPTPWLVVMPHTGSKCQTLQTCLRVADGRYWISAPTGVDTAARRCPPSTPGSRYAPTSIICGWRTARDAPWGVVSGSSCGPRSCCCVTVWRLRGSCGRERSRILRHSVRYPNSVTERGSADGGRCLPTELAPGDDSANEIRARSMHVAVQRFGPLPRLRRQGAGYGEPGR
jgi:hypothetical protein